MSNRRIACIAILNELTMNRLRSGPFWNLGAMIREKEEAVNSNGEVAASTVTAGAFVFCV